VLLRFLGRRHSLAQAKLLGETEIHGHSLLDGAGLMMLSDCPSSTRSRRRWGFTGRGAPRKIHVARPARRALPARDRRFLAARMKFDEPTPRRFSINSAAATFSDVLDRFVWDGVIPSPRAAQ